MNTLAGRVLPAFFLPLLAYATVAQGGACEDVAQTITYWYNNTVDDCGADPASDCSGVLLRGTHRAPNGEYDVWNPSPKSEASGGVSASWMRRDGIEYKDPGLLTNNGIIFKPRDSQAEDEKLNILCAYPLDAWTDYRSQAGCGDFKEPNAADRQAWDGNVEKSCFDTGIKPGTDWKTQHYDKLRSSWTDKHKQQCYFDMKTQYRRDTFLQFMRARQSIANTAEAQETQTEVRLETWKKDAPVPIAAFFYSNDAGLQEARKNQQDYFNKTGKWVPVIRMDFPQSSTSQARFSCAANTQAVPPPAAREQGSCPAYIKSAEWVVRDDPFLGKDTLTLAVTPTDCGRKIGPEQTDAMYAELFNKYARDPQWSKYGYGGSMRRQLVCHLTATVDGLAVRDKPTYNLEPVRPYVSNEEALKQGCNPY